MRENAKLGRTSSGRGGEKAVSSFGSPGVGSDAQTSLLIYVLRTQVLRVSLTAGKLKVCGQFAARLASTLKLKPRLTFQPYIRSPPRQAVTAESLCSRSASRVFAFSLRPPVLLSPAPPSW